MATSSKDNNNHNKNKKNQNDGSLSPKSQDYVDAINGSTKDEETNRLLAEFDAYTMAKPGWNNSKVINVTPAGFDTPSYRYTFIYGNFNNYTFMSMLYLRQLQLYFLCKIYRKFYKR